MWIMTGSAIRITDGTTFVKGDELIIHIMAVQTNGGNTIHQ
jgi:hypothetical protein